MASLEGRVARILELEPDVGEQGFRLFGQLIDFPIESLHRRSAIGQPGLARPVEQYRAHLSGHRPAAHHLGESLLLAGVTEIGIAEQLPEQALDLAGDQLETDALVGAAVNQEVVWRHRAARQHQLQPRNVLEPCLDVVGDDLDVPLQGAIDP